MKKKRVKFCRGCKAYSPGSDIVSLCDLGYNQINDENHIDRPVSGFCEKPRTYKELAKLMLNDNK